MLHLTAKKAGMVAKFVSPFMVQMRDIKVVAEMLTVMFVIVETVISTALSVDSFICIVCYVYCNHACNTNVSVVCEIKITYLRICTYFRAKTVTCRLIMSWLSAVLCDLYRTDLFSKKITGCCLNFILDITQ